MDTLQKIIFPHVANRITMDFLFQLYYGVSYSQQIFPSEISLLFLSECEIILSKENMFILSNNILDSLFPF